MKKVLGVLGVFFLALALFLNSNTMNGSTGDFQLANLMSMNLANAECNNHTNEANGFCKNNPNQNCGHCTKTATLTSCKESASLTKDCYDIGF